MGVNFYGVDFVRKDQKAEPQRKPIIASEFLAMLEKVKPKLTWDAESAEHMLKYKVRVVPLLLLLLAALLPTLTCLAKGVCLLTRLHVLQLVGVLQLCQQVIQQPTPLCHSRWEARMLHATCCAGQKHAAALLLVTTWMTGSSSLSDIKTCVTDVLQAAMRTVTITLVAPRLSAYPFARSARCYKLPLSICIMPHCRTAGG
jgi:hypothetical protein